MAAAEQTKEPTEDRPKDQSKEQTEDQPKGQTKELTEDRPKDQTKNQTEDRSKDRSKDQTEDRSKEQTKEPTEDRPKDQSKDQTEDRPKDQSKDQTKEQTVDQPKGQTKEHTKEHTKDQNRDLNTTSKKDKKLIAGKEKEKIYQHKEIVNEVQDLPVSYDAVNRRFVISHKGMNISYATYELKDKTIHITNHYTEPDYRDLGLAEKVTAALFQYARDQDLRITSESSYTDTYLSRYPEQQEYVENLGPGK